MPYIVLILIIFFAFKTFFLTPISNVQGTIFDAQEIGLLLVVFAFLKYVVFPKGGLKTDKLKNPFTILIILFLLFMLMQAGFASLKYDQTIVDGIIRARRQFYHLVFFPMLYILDTPDKIKRFMNYISVIGVILVIFSMVNYFGITIFHHRYAEGHHMRSGIARAIIPGSNLLLFAGLWQLVRYVRKVTSSYWALAYFMLSFGILIFRQTRSKIIALSAVVLLILINNRRYGVLGGLLAAGLIAGGAIGLVMEENILLNPFQSAYSDISQGTGTWGGRAELMKKDLEELDKNIYFGNAAIVIRDSSIGGRSLDTARELAAAAKVADIGYMHFAKFFGLPGILWMLAFIIIFYRKLFRYLKDPTRDPTILRFAGYMFTFIVIVEVTLDFFLSPANMMILYLVVVMLLNSRYDAGHQTTNQYQ